ncbi:hypothetical protein PybrP1_005620, partial [[Pythium] brassicae (nom. inval.)]
MARVQRGRRVAFTASDEASLLLPTAALARRRSRDSFAGRLHRHKSAVGVAGALLVVLAVTMSAAPPPSPLLRSPALRDAAATAPATAFPAKPDGTRDLLQFCEE